MILESKEFWSYKRTKTPEVKGIDDDFREQEIMKL